MPKAGDFFKEKGVAFLDTFVNLSKLNVFERQMVQDSFDTGSMAQIHVSIGALTASKPTPQYERVSGD